MPEIVVSTSSFDVDGNPTLAALRAAGHAVVTNPHGRRLTEAEIAGLVNADTIAILAGLEPLNEQVFQRAPALRVVSRCGIGIDNVDLAAAASRGITVVNTPDAPVAAVAELAVGLMLACLRQVPQLDSRLRAGEWPRHEGALLGARTVGLIGCGRIGRRVGELCRAFGARVVASDPAPAALPEGIARLDLQTLLATADVVSLHAPAPPAAPPLIDAAALARMPRGAILINTARGGLVCLDALAAALDSGHIAAAGLDTFEPEPYHGALIGYRQVVLCPHIGSNARETRQRMEHEAAANLAAALDAWVPAAR